MASENYPISIFTWHIHGTYLYYLSQGPFRIYIPVTKQKNEEGYYGRGETFPFGDNVIEVPIEEVKNISFDCILFQSKKNWTTDQYEILSESQRALPRVYVEHDPPWDSPTETKHVVDDPDVIMVHVTHFNKLMWHNCNRIIRVIDHGVIAPETDYTGKLKKGIVVVNHLHQRGRKPGADIYERVRKEVPLDLIGMGTEEYGGLGEILHPEVPEFISQYRFFFNPIRYTSLGLAVIEGMMTGLPIVALATTEYVTMIRNGDTGFINTNVDTLIENMQFLLDNPEAAVQMGKRGKEYARERFAIDRFAEDWKETFYLAISKSTHYEKETRFYQ